MKVKKIQVPLVISCIIGFMWGGVSASEAPLLKTPRIVTDYGIAVDILIALGVQDSIVGIHTGMSKKSFYRNLFPGMAELPELGDPGRLNVESVLALKPELIIVREREGKNQIDQFREVGYNVISVSAEDWNGLKTAISEIGKATHRETRAQEVLNYHEELRAKVATRIAKIDKEQRPVVYLSGARGLLSIASAAMYQYELIQAAGGIPVGNETTGGWVTVSPEQLLAWNPDYIFISQDTKDTSVEAILSDPRWQTIKAVQNKKVFVFPCALAPWDRPGTQSILGLLWLAQTLFPQLFSDLTILDETEKYYKSFIGKGFAESGGSL